MSSRIAFALCAIPLLLSGCSAVRIGEPIGAPAPIAEVKSLQGSWVNEDGETFEVRSTRSGKLVLGGVEWDENGEDFRAATTELFATRFGELNLLHVKLGNEPPDDGYHFCRYEIEGDTARLYNPILSVFEKAVASNELAGTIQRQQHSIDVYVDSTAETIGAFLETSGAQACFEQEPSTTY